MNTFKGPEDSGWSYAIGDLDGSGEMEIATAARHASVAYVLDSELNKLHEADVDGRVELVADLTGDGYMEIVLLSADGKLTLFDRELTELATIQVGETGGEVIASDVTGDGRIELICRTDNL